MKLNKSDVEEATLEYFDGDQLATEVFVTKYALRNKEGDYLEKTPDDMHKRLAKEFARIEEKFGGPNQLSYEEIYELFKGFGKIVPQGSPMAGVGNKYQVQSLGNCFTLPSPTDSYGGILKTDQELVQIAKRRGGIGFDISSLRPSGLAVQNSAKTTSGLLTFMERFSNSTREVGQNNRRGALLLSVSVHHPDILEVIDAKRNRAKITGANISIKFTDVFMKALQDDLEYEQRWPLVGEPVITKSVRARKVWDAFVESAWDCAEPGALFWDTTLRTTPSDCYKEEGFESVGCNPCCFAKSSDVWVVTDSGMKEIKEITSKDLIWIDEEQCWAGTTGYFDAGEEETFRIRFSNNEELVITKNHKLMKIHESLKYGFVLKLTQLVDLKLLDEILVERQSGAYTTKIESITPTNKIEPVGCIEVEKFHKFTANGVISGNSELNLPKYGSCRLLLLNVTSFIQNPFTKHAKFDSDAFVHAAWQAQRLMDDLVELELECIEKILQKIESDPEPAEIKKCEKELWENIKQKTKLGRRTGTGITGLGDALAMLNIVYGSPESIKMTENIYKSLAIGCYRSTIELAAERGAFPIFSHEKEKNHPFMRKVLGALSKDWQQKYKKCGRRNIALTTTAPAGSVSCLTQTTSGIEPVFLLEYTRRRKLTGEEGVDVDFVDDLGDRWIEFAVRHKGLSEWSKITGKSDIKESPYYNATSNDVDWVASVDLQAAAQKWLCHSISKTVSLPKSATKELVSQCYIKAWQSGCKGLTVYRDGSRSGVLIAPEASSSNFPQNDSPKRPDEVQCDIYHTTVRGEAWLVIVGLIADKPFEIFCGLADKIKIPRKHISGSIVKNKRKTVRSVYDLVIGEADDQLIIKDIVATFDNPQHTAFARTISLSLRHGAKPRFVAEQLMKDPDSNMHTFAKCVARCLKRYIADGEHCNGKKTLEGCETPDKCQLVYQEGCVSCRSCSKSACQ